MHQTLHFVYHTYLNSMKVGPGAVLLPLTMIAPSLTFTFDATQLAGCGAVAGGLQYRAETQLRALEPVRFPPSPVDLAKELHRRWKRGESM